VSVDRSVTIRLRVSSAEFDAAMARAGTSVRVLRGEVEGAGRAGSGQGARGLDDMGRSAEKAKAPVIGLWTALAAVAPAAVPIGAVAVGALIGLLPVAATVALGISGISKQMKAGALQGTELGAQVNVLKADLVTLQTTAASGLLSGLGTAMTGLKPLFGVVNADVKTMAGQIGTAAGTAVPALVTVLTQLNPLFTTMGALLVTGAAHLAHWASSTTGIHSFVAYVQTQLPAVLSLVGNLVTLISHLAQASAPLGGVILGGFGLLVRVLDSLPIGVLQTLIPLVEATFLAFKTYQGITFLVATVNTALAAHATAAAATAAAVSASALAEAAVVAEAAATEATARAAVAAETAAASAEIAATMAGTGSVFEAEAVVVATASAEEAAAFQLAADAAIAAAAEISGAAAEAATAVRASGAAAGAGWAAMLGPIGAVAVGVGILAMVLGNSDHSAQDAAKAMNTYAESVKTSTDATSAANVAQTNKNLSDQGELTALADLHAQNLLLGVSQQDLTTYITGTKEQAIDIANAMDGSMGPATADQSEKIYRLGYQLRTLRNGLSDAVKAQLLYAQATRDSQVAIDGGNTAVARNARMLGVSSDAYLTAQQAAQKNTASTQAQTLAFQMENNAAGLVNQALATMAGQNLSIAQAKTADAQATMTLTASLKTNGSTVSDNTTKGLANQQALEGKAASLRSVLTAEAAGTTGTAKATTEYHHNADALLAQIKNQYGASSAIYAYAQNVLKIPKVAPTRAEILKAKAEADLKTLERALRNVPGYKNIAITADTSAAISALQRLAGVQLSYTAGSNKRAAGSAYAVGGWVPGTGTADSVPALLAPREFVVTAAAAARNAPLLEAINDGGGTAIPAPAAYNSASARPVTAAPGGFDYARLAAAVAQAISRTPVPVDASGEFRIRGRDLQAMVAAGHQARSA